MRFTDDSVFNYRKDILVEFVKKLNRDKNLDLPVTGQIPNLINCLKENINPDERNRVVKKYLAELGYENKENDNDLD